MRTFQLVAMVTTWAAQLRPIFHSSTLDKELEKFQALTKYLTQYRGFPGRLRPDNWGNVSARDDVMVLFNGGDNPKSAVRNRVPGSVPRLGHKEFQDFSIHLGLIDESVIRCTDSCTI